MQQPSKLVQENCISIDILDCQSSIAAGILGSSLVRAHMISVASTLSSDQKQKLLLYGVSMS